MCSPDQFIPDIIAALFISPEPGVQKIGKENQPEDEKKNEKFDQDNGPKSPANGHVPETIKVKQPYPFDDIQWVLRANQI